MAVVCQSEQSHVRKAKQTTGSSGAEGFSTARQEPKYAITTEYALGADQLSAKHP